MEICICLLTALYNFPNPCGPFFILVFMSGEPVDEADGRTRRALDTRHGVGGVRPGSQQARQSTEKQRKAKQKGFYFHFFVWISRYFFSPVILEEDPSNLVVLRFSHFFTTFRDFFCGFSGLSCVRSTGEKARNRISRCVILPGYILSGGVSFLYININFWGSRKRLLTF